MKWITDKELRQVIPKGFHYLLDYKEELAYILDAQLTQDKAYLEQVFNLIEKEYREGGDVEELVKNLRGGAGILKRGDLPEGMVK